MASICPLPVASRSPLSCLSSPIRPMLASPTPSCAGCGAIFTSNVPLACIGAALLVLVRHGGPKTTLKPARDGKKHQVAQTGRAGQHRDEAGGDILPAKPLDQPEAERNRQQHNAPAQR